MAKPKRDWGGVFVGIVSSVATVGVAALFIDWMKASGHWPGGKTLPANGDFGCDTGCIGNETDEIVQAAEKLKDA